MFRAAAAALALVLPATASADCRLGEPLAERALIQPKAGTPYASDALNPDVVVRGGRIHLYFSANDTPGERQAGPAYWHKGQNWRTMRAVASHPFGPYRIGRRVWPFYNGGTAIRDGKAYTLANDAANPFRLVLFAGDRPVARTPSENVPPWRAAVSDAFLEPSGRRAYFVGRSGQTGADIGTVLVDGWRRFEKVVVRGRAGSWDAEDLGEPATFRSRSRTLMLYGGMPARGRPRIIGMARKTPGGWRKCGPVLGVSRRYPGNAIDPFPLVHRGRLYVFFGGGQVPSEDGGMRGAIFVRQYRLP